MKIVADESVEVEIVRALRKVHNVRAVAEESPGLDDSAVLSISLEENAVLLTADKDFGELVHRRHQSGHGVVLLRLASVRAAEKAAIVEQAFARYADRFSGCFSVISPGQVRALCPDTSLIAIRYTPARAG